MSTSHGNHVSLARHNYPQSPFNRAREPNYEFDLDTSNFPTPSKQNGTRSRHSYKTGTLAGAYRAASRASMEENVQMGMSPSPRQARVPFSAFSPNSDTSNPRAEPMDMYGYGRIEEDAPLTNHVSLNGWNSPRGSRTASRTSRSSRDREYEEPANHGLAISEASLFSDVDRYSPRRRTTDYSKDEQRLRRVTGKDSPVFSRAKVGARAALTADNLSRREEEQAEVESQHFSEEDNERGPSLNLPSTWGSRATRREWPRNVSQPSVSDQSKENEEEKPNLSERIFQSQTATNDTSAKLRHSPRSLEREQTRIPTRNALQERTFNPPVQDAQEAPEPEEKTSKRKFDFDQNSPDANPIPNTPITIFKGASFTKPNYPKRDSQDLLRRLSRTESPKMEQMQTPDPPKLFERRIYDKTPRVTGAWIDTPMTERVTQIPSDLTKDIVAPPVVEKEPTPPVQETKPPVEAQTKPENPQPEAPKSQAPKPGILKENKTNGVKETTGAKAAPTEEPKPAKRPRPEVHRPKLPKSGLETVMEDVNSGKETLDLGDDTIESLRAIMDDPMDTKTESEEEAAEAAYEQEVLERLRLAEARLHDGQRSVDFDRLNEKLASLATNVNQVKKGLDSLETKVSRGRTITSQPSTSAKTSSNDTCEHGVSHSDGRVYAAIPLPRFWTQDSSTGRRQITKLGGLTLGLLSWWIIECMMVDQFSHPIISDTCSGYCLRPDAPEFPFVTVTMLWRWSHLSTILMPILTILMAVARLLAQLLGLWDGYVDEPTSVGNLIGEIRINGTPVAFPWLSSTAAPQVLTPPQQTVQQPIWTPREAPPRQQPIPARSDDEQPSMDEDEYI